VDTPGRKGAEETGRVKEHAVLGYLFVRDGLRLGTLPAHVAYQHHERQDGNGYPRRLSGTNRIVQGAEMHLPGRITPLAEVAAIADFYDSCSCDRPERRRMAPDQVRQRLSETTGHHLNRDIVKEFVTVVPPYPVGTQVAVTGGRFRNHTGVVARLNADALDRPVIRLLANPAGDRIAPIDLDLRKDEAKIQGLVSADAAALAAV
jgi:HD-GYP domain-containing protein (c-di-GMP phosphodiesterase class II)